jgi:hypothetical protein
LQSNDALKELKGPLLPFLTLSLSERATLILKLLEKDLGGSQRQVGVARFESLLEQFGLGGGVAPLVKRTLLELWAVRNLVAHKNGVADLRFIETCPWFSASPGTQLFVSPLHYRRYSLASTWYIGEVTRRLLAAYPQHAPVDERPTADWEAFLQRNLLALQQLSEQKEK